MAIKAGTTTASGMPMRRAERSQTVMLPGPAWAATGIQRGAAMQMIANNVRSRIPSSRRKPEAGSGARSTAEAGAGRSRFTKVVRGYHSGAVVIPSMSYVRCANR